MTAGQTDLVTNLSALRRGVGATTTLKTILDASWFDSVEQAILSGSPSHAVPDPTGFLDDFCHPLRGVEWFEKDQDLALSGRLAEIDDNGKVAVSLTGLDPIRTVLPKIEERLSAFAALTFKETIVAKKFDELRARRTGPSFKNYLFELSVLEDLALRGILVDIEEPETHVDGVVRIDNREILVERRIPSSR